MRPGSRLAGDEAREEEGPADDAAILAQQQRLRHGHARAMEGAQDRELDGARKADAEPRRGIAAQRQHPLAGKAAAVEARVEAPILLHGAVGQAADRRDLDAARCGGAGEPAREPGGDHTLATAWPPSTGRTAPVM